MGKIGLYLVVKRPNLSTLSTEFSTFNFRFSQRVWKETPFPTINISFTVHSQPGGNRNPGIPARIFRVFHIFPTPYYGYYNKFNILLPPVSSRFQGSSRTWKKRRDISLNIVCDKTC